MHLKSYIPGIDILLLQLRWTLTIGGMLDIGEVLIKPLSGLGDKLTLTRISHPPPPMPKLIQQQPVNLNKKGGRLKIITNCNMPYWHTQLPNKLKNQHCMSKSSLQLSNPQYYCSQCSKMSKHQKFHCSLFDIVNFQIQGEFCLK